MIKNLRSLWIASAIAAVSFTSCAYDAYDYSASSGRSYRSGYGSSSPNTSLFIRTGDSRWGYDPNRRSYYDYNRGCYYDHNRNGYYPSGYCPQANYGVSHPYGWDAGRGYCPPPRNVCNTTITTYSGRSSSYRDDDDDDHDHGRWGRQPERRPGGFFGGGGYSRPQEDRHDSDHRAPQQNFRGGNPQPSAPSRPQNPGPRGAWFGNRQIDTSSFERVKSSGQGRGGFFSRNQSASLGSQPEPPPAQRQEAPPQQQSQPEPPRESAPPPAAPEPPPAAPEPAPSAPEPPAAVPDKAE
jgi:hypothetical protein